MAKRSFQYQQRGKDAIKERANQSGGDFDTIIKPQYKVYKVREGKNLLRILPPTWDKAKHYGYDIHINYGIGADNQKYLSLSKMKGEPDPLHEARRKAERDGDEEVSRALRPNKRVLMWVIDRLDEDEGPQLWDAPVSLDKGIAGASFDDDTNEIMYIDDPEEGCDVRFHREGTGLKTKYPGEKIKILPKGPVHEDEAQQGEWLDYVNENPVPDCLQYYSYDHIAEVFNGNVRTANDDEDEDKKPARKPREESKKTARKPEPEPEEDEEPPFEEEEVKPKVRSRQRAEPDEEAEEAPPIKPGSIRDRLTKARQGLSKRSQVDEED